MSCGEGGGDHDRGRTRGGRRRYPPERRRSAEDQPDTSELRPTGICAAKPLWLGWLDAGSFESQWEAHLGGRVLCFPPTGSAQKFQNFLLNILLKVRTNQFNILVRGRKLSQQFWVDQWAKVERLRLLWAKNNQKKLKAERYKGLIDAQSNDDLPNAGKVIILPASITGSPRWYVEQLMDAMAIVRVFGKPTLFNTFTCNPYWDDIVNSLEEGESAYDRPDIVARVFNAKLAAMMDALVKQSILGEVVYWVYTIEWQKRRGLPHCHMLMKLKNEPRTPAEVDALISAEIPGPDDPILRKLVEDHMIHGPCGQLNRKCVCMEQVFLYLLRDWMAMLTN